MPFLRLPKYRIGSSCGSGRLLISSYQSADYLWCPLILLCLLFDRFALDCSCPRVLTVDGQSLT